MANQGWDDLPEEELASVSQWRYDISLQLFAEMSRRLSGGSDREEQFSRKAEAYYTELWTFGAGDDPIRQVQALGHRYPEVHNVLSLESIEFRPVDPNPTCIFRTERLVRLGMKLAPPCANDLRPRAVAALALDRESSLWFHRDRIVRLDGEIRVDIRYNPLARPGLRQLAMDFSLLLAMPRLACSTLCSDGIVRLPTKARDAPLIYRLCEEALFDAATSLLPGLARVAQRLLAGHKKDYVLSLARGAFEARWLAATDTIDRIVSRQHLMSFLQRLWTAESVVRDKLAAGFTQTDFGRATRLQLETILQEPDLHDALREIERLPQKRSFE